MGAIHVTQYTGALTEGFAVTQAPVEPFSEQEIIVSNGATSERSQQLESSVSLVRLYGDVAFWYKFGKDDVSAAKDATSVLVPAGVEKFVSLRSVGMYVAVIDN